jgi:hypothetical protein
MDIGSAIMIGLSIYFGLATIGDAIREHTRKIITYKRETQ